MKILMINQAFYPDVAATAQHGHDLARYLTSKGHQVTAIASPSLYGESGASLPRRETVDGIDIRRVGVSYFGKTGMLARVVDYLYFYVVAALLALRLPRHDVVICFTTPPFIAIMGVMLRLFKGTKVVYWVMDLFPELPIACGMMREGSAPSWLMERVSRFCLRHSDMNVVLGRCMEERILAKGIPPEQVRQIGVWSDQEAIQPIPREDNEYRAKWGVEDRLVVMYSGNFGLGHDVDTFLNAALALKDDDRIRFAFIGGGKKKGIVEAFISEHGLERNCILEPFQPRSKLDELLSAGDVHLISLLDGIQGVMIPCKLFGILAVGRPALFIGNPASEVSRVIEENRCGRTITLGDSTELVEAITTYERDPGERQAAGERARRAFMDQHSMEHRCRAWLELLEQVAN